MSAGHQHQQSSSSFNIMHIISQFLFMMFITMMDDIAKAIPKVYEDIRALVTSRVKNTVESSVTAMQKNAEQLKDTAISLTTRHNINSIIMSRIYEHETDASKNTNHNNKPNSEQADSMVDAIISYISRLHNIPTLKLINNGHFIVAYKDKPIQIANSIYVKIDNVALSPTGMISSIKFTVASNSLSASEITQFIKKIHQDYQQEMKNSLGSNIYFFDQKSRDGSGPPPVPIGINDPAAIRNHKAMLINTAPKNLNFTMTPFYSNKQFTNIFGKEIRDIEQRVKFFVENKDWYDKKGIPYQLGILLSGIPGAGKTSVIRAIANYTKRHIINVNFANITTATQLKNLFYSDKLTVYLDTSLMNSQAFHIPIEQRLYVLEEIDAIGDIVKQRTAANSKNDHPINDELTLAEILTVMDGTMEVPGRIVIMTSNHPEILDKALIRPGRIDLQTNFTYASRDLIKEMYEAYLDETFPQDLLQNIPHEELTPAEVGQVMFRHFNTNSRPYDILRDLQTTASKHHKATTSPQPEIMKQVRFQHVDAQDLSNLEKQKCDIQEKTDEYTSKPLIQITTEKKEIDHTTKDEYIKDTYTKKSQTEEFLSKPLFSETLGGGVTAFSPSSHHSLSGFTAASFAPLSDNHGSTFACFVGKGN
jgi:hypothetical protein